jgi:hypothetical protein
MKKLFKSSFIVFLLFNCSKKADNPVPAVDICKSNYISFTVDGVTRNQFYTNYNGGPASSGASSYCSIYNTDNNDVRLEFVSPKDSSELVGILKVLPKKFNVTPDLTNPSNDVAIKPPFTFNCNLSFNDNYYTTIASSDTANYYNQITTVKLNKSAKSITWDIEGQFKVNVVNTQNSSDIKTITGFYKYSPTTSNK